MSIKAEIVSLISGEILEIEVEDLDTEESGISRREAVLLEFADHGIDLAFSGKGKNEKGVIIDLDDSFLDKLNSENHPLKLGRTVIVVSQSDD
jgi:hypothetical protein